MKKFSFIILFVLIFSTICFADNTKRITELNNEKEQLQERLTQYQNAVQNIQIRLIEINAVVEELQRQDREALQEEDE